MSVTQAAWFFSRLPQPAINEMEQMLSDRPEPRDLRVACSRFNARSLMGIDSYGVPCARFTGTCSMDKQMIGLISMRRSRSSPHDWCSRYEQAIVPPPFGNEIDSHSSWNVSSFFFSSAFDETEYLSFKYNQQFTVELIYFRCFVGYSIYSILDTYTMII